MADRQVFSCPTCGRHPQISEDMLTRSHCIGSATGVDLDGARVAWNHLAWEHMIEGTRDFLRQCGVGPDGKVFDAVD